MIDIHAQSYMRTTHQNTHTRTLFQIRQAGPLRGPSHTKHHPLGVFVADRILAVHFMRPFNPEVVEDYYASDEAEENIERLEKAGFAVITITDMPGDVSISYIKSFTRRDLGYETPRRCVRKEYHGTGWDGFQRSAPEWAKRINELGGPPQLNWSALSETEDASQA